MAESIFNTQCFFGFQACTGSHFRYKEFEISEDSKYIYIYIERERALFFLNNSTSENNTGL
jgi:hypothetical protein